MSRFTRAVAKCNKDSGLRCKVREMFGIPVEYDNQWNVLDEVAVPVTSSSPVTTVPVHESTDSSPPPYSLVEGESANQEQEQEKDDEATTPDTNEVVTPVTAVVTIEEGMTGGLKAGETYLICVHYEQTIVNPHSSVRKLRGQIIAVSVDSDDNKTLTLVSDTTGAFEPLTVFSPLMSGSEDGKYHALTDVGEKVFSHTSKFYLGFESVKIRIFDFQGQRYFSTHTKIKGDKSKWTQDTFYSLFSKHLDPSSIVMPLSTTSVAEASSDKMDDKTNDKVSQLTFILLDPVLCLAGSYVAEKLMLLNTDVPDDFLPGIERYKPVELEVANNWIFPKSECVRSVIEEGTYCRQLFLTADGKVECNLFHTSEDPALNDPRLMPGDFIVVEDGGEFTRLDTVRMRYASSITGADPYPYHHFCTQAKKFIDSDIGLRVLPAYYNSNGVPFNLKSYKERVQLWMVILWDAISPVHKSSVLNWTDKFLSDIKMVAHFITYRYRQLTPQHLTEIADKRKILSRECQKNISRIHDKTAKRVVAKPNKRTDFNAVLCDTIANWLTFNETADSVYKLISSIGRYNRVFGTTTTTTITNTIVSPSPSSSASSLSSSSPSLPLPLPLSTTTSASA